MSTTFAYTVGQLVTNSYRKLGFLPSGGVPTNDQMNQGLLDYNLMITGEMSDGTNLWRRTQLSLPVAAQQGVPGNPLTITPLILDFSDARWVIQPAPNLYERPLAWDYPYSWYFNLPNKLAFNSSGPSIAVFDRQQNASNVYLWPPCTQPGTLNCTVARSINTVASPTDPLDFPVEWQEGLSYMLADRLMEDEGLADAAGGQVTAQRITQHALAFTAKLLAFDRPTSIMIRPFGKQGQGKFWRS